LVHVRSIVCIATGVRYNSQTRLFSLRNSTPIPTLNQIQTAVMYGLGVRSPSDTKLLTFDKSWDAARMNSFLRQLLPKLFGYLSTKNPWIHTATTNKDLQVLPYVLLARSGKNLVPAVSPDGADPTGLDYFENSGRDSAAFKNRLLFIGVVETIQPKVYMSWNSNGMTAPGASPDSNSDDEWRSVDEDEIEIGPVETRLDTPVPEKRRRVTQITTSSPQSPQQAKRSRQDATSSHHSLPISESSSVAHSFGPVPAAVSMSTSRSALSSESADTDIMMSDVPSRYNTPPPSGIASDPIIISSPDFVTRPGATNPWAKRESFFETYRF